jgi:hypothetical protein
VLIILISTRHAKIPIRPALNRPSHRLHGKLQPSNLPRLLHGVSPDSPQSRRSDQDIFHHSVRYFLLYNDVVQTQKCRCNIPMGYTKVSTSQLGHNVEAYIDNMVVMTWEDG